jgi:tetratricopeptide (TPR) repeat protein
MSAEDIQRCRTEAAHWIEQRELIALIGESPENPHLLAHYAVTVLRAGQFEKAQALAREAGRLAPDDGFVLAIVALTDLGRGRRLADIAALDALVRNEPDAERTLRMMAYALVREHRLAAAQDASDTLVRMAPRDRDNIRLAASIRYQRHWSMVPLYPVLRWGWPASIAMYVGVFVLLRLGSDRIPGAWLAGIAMFWVAYVIYSWVWPPLLRRWKFPEVPA